MYELSTRSLRKLDSVHDDLARVARKAIQITRVDFGISEGVRSYQRQVELMKDKKTTTLHSLHLLQNDGYSHAIDVFAYMNGKTIFNDPKYYGPIVQAFMTTAISLGVQIECGHLWKNFHDSFHFQLNQKYY